jgi:hypothetical protein
MSIRLLISSNIMGILNSTTDKKSTLNQCIIYYICISRTYPKYLPHASPTQRKKKQSLALSRKKIEAERIIVKLRTEQRIAKLYADAGRSSELVLKDWHGCLNTSCFFLTLLCMKLLFCHWLYPKSTVTVNKV